MSRTDLRRPFFTDVAQMNSDLTLANASDGEIRSIAEQLCKNASFKRVL
jgi:hypothetical protein